MPGSDAPRSEYGKAILRLDESPECLPESRYAHLPCPLGTGSRALVPCPQLSKAARGGPVGSTCAPPLASAGARTGHGTGPWRT